MFSGGMFESVLALFLFFFLSSLEILLDELIHRPKGEKKLWQIHAGSVKGSVFCAVKDGSSQKILKVFGWNDLLFSVRWNYCTLAKCCFFSSYQLRGMSYRVCFGFGWFGSSRCEGRNCFQKQFVIFYVKFFKKKKNNNKSLPYYFGFFNLLLLLNLTTIFSSIQWRTVASLCHWQTWSSMSQTGLCMARR